MKHISKKLLALTLALVTTLSLSGCSLFAQFDAASYTQAVLDAATKAEFDKYIELTGSTTEDAQAEYDEVLESFLTEYEELSISDELLEKYKQLFIELLAKTKYSVGEAEKDGKTFIVPLTIEPLIIYDGFDEEIEEASNAFREELEAEVAESGEIPSEDELLERSYQLAYDIMSARIASATYGEPQTITVTVSQNSDGLWGISDSDYTAIVSLLVEQP
ncbi:MAG: hypothetical protein HDR01_12855 [Lachnospiraceae bacterium]|nr:hypothetical protein [Lachnospiraceae bacterium]